ncbi:MAG: hypothetical protein U0487_02730 [Patescibacteria group bacterium]
MNGLADKAASQSFVKAYQARKIIYVKIAGTMDLATNEFIAKECADIVKSGGPWTGIADLTTMRDFDSKGTGVWQEVFKTITANINRVYIATSDIKIRLVTRAWGFFVSRNVYALDTMAALIEKAKADQLYLPEDVLLKRDFTARTRRVTR